MSRVGRMPVLIPDKVQVKIEGSTVKSKGPLGELQVVLPREISVEQKGSELILGVRPEAVRNQGVSALFGMARARVANIVAGVHQGFRKDLEIHGLGYRAQVTGQKLTMTLGFSHPSGFDIPKGVKIEVDKKSTKLALTGIDKDLLGETAARIRGLKIPEPYKGAGIRYQGERVRRKAGKTAAGAGGGAKK